MYDAQLQHHKLNQDYASNKTKQNIKTSSKGTG
jgi:hypothetical protein